MLYVLLIIIAIGVLLASEGGKELLNWILIVLGIIGLLYIGFWIIMIAIGVFSSGGFKNIIIPIIGEVAIAGYILYGIFVTYKGFKKGDYTVKKLLPHIKKVVLIFSAIAFLWVGSYYLVSFLSK